MQWEIFPLPKKITRTQQGPDFNSAQWVIVDAVFSGIFLQHAIDFTHDINRFFLNRLTVCRGTPEYGQALLVIKQITEAETGGNAQYYKCSTENDCIVLLAGSEAAAYYGLQTLHQLMMQTGSSTGCFAIEDYPDIHTRGVLLDISRCKVPTLDTLCRLITLFAKLKYNQLQLYMEHTFAFSAHTSVWYDASPLTAEEILILDRYCREHYIDLVPNFNSFGHFERWLKHPQYRHLAESPDGFRHESGIWFPSGSTLMPDAGSLAFLDTLYREFLPNFSGRFFHAGLDETWELGKGRSRPLCEKAGTLSVYTDFLLGIHKLVKQYNRQMMFWADMIIKEPSLLKKLPVESIACIWGYEADHPFAVQAALFQDAHRPFYICPGTSSWNSITGRTDNCLANIRNSLQPGNTRNAAGCLVTDWGDNGHHQHLPISYPGFTAGAGYSWNCKAGGDADLASALDRIVFDGKAAGAGKLLLELGRVHNGIPVKFPNETMINRMLFCNEDDLLLINNIPPAALHNCLERLEAVEDELAGFGSRDNEWELTKAELGNTVKMARFGIHRGLSVHNNGNGKATKESALLHELESIIFMYEQLWLKRNRPGGLRESSDRLRNVHIKA